MWVRGSQGDFIPASPQPEMSQAAISLFRYAHERYVDIFEPQFGSIMRIWIDGDACRLINQTNRTLPIIWTGLLPVRSRRGHRTGFTLTLGEIHTIPPSL